MLDQGNPLLILALVLVAGVFSGQLARRFRLPAVTGQILAGILLGPSVLNIAGVAALHGLHPVTQFALGLMGVAVGNHLNLKRLRNARNRLLWLLLFEVTITPALVFLAIYMMPDVTWSFAFLLATMAISTAPATIVALVKEERARGVYVKTLVAAVALNNIACIAFFEMAHTAARVSRGVVGSGGVDDVLMAPFIELGASAGIGFGMGALLVLATRRLVRSDQLATASMAAILLTAGLADHLGFSSLLSCLFLGVTLANLTPDKDEIGHTVFSNFESAILAIFFTLAGMELDFGYVVPGGLLALLVVGTRMAGKLVAGRLAMKVAGAPRKLRENLGFGLIPQAGVAVGLVLLIQEDPSFADISALFLAVGLSSVTLNEIIGPIMTRIAIARSGEAGRDRARLIDFLHEENILIGLRARNKSDLIEEMVDHLVATTHVGIQRDRFLDNVLQREADISTCVGHGLAIPHGELEKGDEIVGVMGISPTGLDVETPDDQPLHCVILLATPRSQRDRHLEVLAAFAKAVGADANVQRQLYHAKSPAHAYEILHAEDAEDFNYYLDEDYPG
jgi:Kef-type K+ transport system membrane component KefB/mannitol/fructose-specific phosphotransferase system IIA component